MWSSCRKAVGGSIGFAESAGPLPQAPVVLLACYAPCARFVGPGSFILISVRRDSV